MMGYYSIAPTYYNIFNQQILKKGEKGNGQQIRNISYYYGEEKVFIYYMQAQHPKRIILIYNNITDKIKIKKKKDI